MHYMLTGSMAMNLYATPRMTRDLDFVVAIAPGMVSQLAIVFPEAAEAIENKKAKEKK